MLFFIIPYFGNSVKGVDFTPYGDALLVNGEFFDPYGDDFAPYGLGFFSLYG